MRILLFGQSGQVARELDRRAPAGAILDSHGRDSADFSDPDRCVDLLRASGAEVVISAVAYTAVDRAEEDEALATTVNATTPGALAVAAAERDMPFLHISTDYVFDGTGDRPWQPDDPTAPLGAYGRSKLAGELAVRAAGGVHAILRTSWVFSAHGNNFVRTMLRLSETRDRLTIVADQVGGPTAAADIADALWTMAAAFQAGQGTSGTYHFAGAPDVSWADFARQIFAQAGRTTEVVDIPTSDYPTPAARPGNSRLDCAGLRQAFGIERPDWRQSLADVMRDISK